jgi:membrane peptidoglycan carboxypeptidase
MIKVIMKRDTKWQKKEEKLRKGQTVEVDTATASKWIRLNIAEYPKDEVQTVGEMDLTADKMKDLKMDQLYILADQYGVKVKPGTPKTVIIKKINEKVNPTVNFPVEKKVTQYIDEEVIKTSDAIPETPDESKEDNVPTALKEDNYGNFND